MGTQHSEHDDAPMKGAWFFIEWPNNNPPSAVYIKGAEDAVDFMSLVKEEAFLWAETVRGDDGKTVGFMLNTRMIVAFRTLSDEELEALLSPRKKK